MTNQIHLLFSNDDPDSYNSNGNPGTLFSNDDTDTLIIF